MPYEGPRHQELALSDLLDRILHKGIVISGEATITLAGVDLVYIGLQVLITSVENVNKTPETDSDRMEKS